MPKHRLERRAYRFAMDTSYAESQTLFGVLDRCWEVRNVLAADREEDRRANRALREAGQPVRYLTLDDQNVRVAALQKEDPRYQGIHSQVLQNISRRIDEGTKRWLESLKAPGERKISPPGKIERKDYSSFTFPQCGGAIGISGGKVHLSKLGSFNLFQHRKYRGTPKTLTIRFEQGQWWAILVCAMQAKSIYRDVNEVKHLPDAGGDPGLATLLTLSDGTAFDPPRALKDALVELRHAQRDLSRKFEHRKALYEAEAARRKAADLPALPPLREVPYSGRLKAQIKRVAIIHTKVDRVREYHHCKLASILDDSYHRVAVEEHSVAFMFKSRRRARFAADRAIAAMKHWIGSKLGERMLKTTNRRPGIGGNSQTCLCEASVPKGLSDREHVCPECGLAGKRDVVSANIVMQIAFGRNLLRDVEQAINRTLTVAGQAVVRRGGTKGRRLPLTAESMNPSNLDGGKSASEAPVKRQPQSSLQTRKIRGGEPTRLAKSDRITPGGISPGVLLPEAQSLVSGNADGKHRRSGR